MLFTGSNNLKNSQAEMELKVFRDCFLCSALELHLCLFVISNAFLFFFSDELFRECCSF